MTMHNDYLVTFRKENDNLTALCQATFATSAQAKQHIEDDAKFFCSKHPGAKALGWRDPDATDYYAVKLRGGKKCFWQYFEVPHFRVRASSKKNSK